MGPRRPFLLSSLVVLLVALAVWWWGRLGPVSGPDGVAGGSATSTKALDPAMTLEGTGMRERVEPAPLPAEGGEAAPRVGVQPDPDAPVDSAVVRGVVVDDDGVGVEGALVFVLEERGARVFKTDAEGRFRVTGTRAKSEPLRLAGAAPGDFTRGSSAGEVLARDGDVEVTLRLRRKTVTTFVLEGWKGTRAGLWIRSDGGADHRLDIGSSGRVEVSGLEPASSYTVLAADEKQNQVGILLGLRPGDATSHTIKLIKGLPLSVDIAGADGFDSVSVDAVIGNVAPFARRRGQARWEFTGLPEGVWRIRVQALRKPSDTQVVEAEAWVEIPRPDDEPLAVALPR